MTTTYNYTLPMLIFMCLGVLALVFALLLKAEDRKKGYGLELPNIQN
jgi:phosphotransferase system  glucose/maltose/N-acetylglucosamine-specific IIC component